MYYAHIVQPTRESRQSVFRQIARRSYINWPVYDSTPLYDRTSVVGLESDIRTVSEAWFGQDTHDSVEWFVSAGLLQIRGTRPLRGFDTLQMDSLFRVFVLKELHGWEHETALVEYLDHRPELYERLDVETVPDQSTLWRSWNDRFTFDLRETVKTTARTILIKAQNAGVSVPREPDRNPSLRGDDADEPQPDDQTILEEAAPITDHVSHIVFPAFSLDRGEGCEIHENAYWDLQTYLGLRENLAANEGARSFIHESTRDRHRWATLIGSIYATSLSSRFERCTDRP